MATKTGAPRKYLGTGTGRRINPDWQEWKDASDFAWIARLDDPARYWPADFGKDLGDGAWIMVVEVPHTALQWDLPLLSIWRARPHRLSSGLAGRRAYQAVIATPAGDLHLWPHEYVILTDPTGILTDPAVEVHTLGGDPLLDEEHLWYLMSRGIPQGDAARLLLPHVRGLDYAYATLPPEAVDALEGFGQPLWRHIQLHPRARKD